MQFSSVFKQLCRDKGVTQKQALTDMGLHRNAAQRWISGTPSSETLTTIARYFGITVDELLNIGKEDNKKTAIQTDDGANEIKPTTGGERLSKDEFFALYEALDESTREAIRILLKAK